MTVDTQSRTLSQLNVYAQESTRTGIMTCYQQLSSPTIAMAYAKGFWRYEMSPGIFDAALASSALNLAILLPTLALIRFYSGSRMIRASAPIFLVIIVLGAILLTVSAVSFAILPSENFQSLCQLRLWLFVLGMVNVLAPLFVKTYRVAQIFTDASKGAVVKLPNSVLLRWVAIANLVLIVLMAGQIGIGELRSQFEVDMAPGIAAPTDDVVAQIGQCSSNTPFIILLVVIFACFTAWGATTAWKVRTAPSDFNESSQISIAILFIAAYATVMIPVQFLVGSNPVALVVIRSLGLNIGIFISSIVLFLPKVMIILQGRADEKPQTMMSGTQVTKFSTKAVTTLSTQA
ncbi:G-protein coupled receptors family 3 profile domain-containing protein [Plasmodiophora brassicae]|uniref:G-protein coupled receptors family 3 profile domain-containing protein n=1 Tax=Plasmodiophora brassicae TaxID=37360 RepID=A0A0G4J6U3_PLABS|nr:hypothetical protein PBRA_009229 [Plasmodiophora brassicae]SPR00271.1 unnamed protein product [Plasmodiophora brassicae]